MRSLRLNDIVDLFFTELAYYNDAYVNYGGDYNQEAYDLKAITVIHLYPFDSIVAEDYNVDDRNLSFHRITYQEQLQMLSTSQVELLFILNVTININGLLN